MNFKLLNNVGGWLVFFIALVTYTMTVEPTASFWDCGEFIACAYKLEVPHPSGAPFYLLIGRLFSMFAGSDVSRVAYWVNMVSVLSSAFTILFLFWTISLLARKIIGKTAESLDTADSIQVIGASLVGSLVYTFSDSFWFSAVEAEVYGISSFFTAIVAWAAFRWELIKGESAQNRWLLLIAYLVGLSIGVHLLNLVTIPGMALLYYFNKNEKPTFKGGFIAFMIGMVILGFIQVGIITGIPTLGFAFDKFMVNTIGLPFASGLMFFVIIVIGGLSYGIYKTQNSGKVIQNTALLSFAFLLFGYATYTIALIRSNYNPPINENNPSDVLGFTYYLKREQYGSRPLFYGPVYSERPVSSNQGSAVYKKGKDSYEVIDYQPEYVYDGKSKMLIPRLWSTDPNHVSLYKQKLNIPSDSEAKPSFAKNLSFMFSHQMGHMYWRYFLWNFWGRASDVGDTGATNIFEKRSDLPELYAKNKGRTNYWGIPAILGLLGALYHYMKKEKDALITLIFFLFTGVGLVFYINSPPVEPRERDYIYVGSFYFFAIWIGISILAISDWVLKFISSRAARYALSTVLGLAVPVLMAKEAWAGHDRSNRVHQVDFAKNLLNSCEKNAILFTGGDNDTFPLWYVQEVEGFRTDVRVCNLSLLGTDWYIEQMKRKTYESEALPISLATDNYLKGKNDQIVFNENPNPEVKAGINLKDYLKLVNNNDPAIQMQYNTGEVINILPSANFYFDQDIEAIKKMNIVDPLYLPNLSGRFAWNFGNRDIMKSDLIMLDVIANNNWKRPIYFSGTLATGNYLNLKEYCQVEGYAYRLMPFRVEGARDGFVNSKILANTLDKKMFWRGLNDDKIYYDSETYLKVPIITARYSYLRLVDQLVREGKKEEAEKYMDKALELLPDKAVPYDQIVANFPMFYYEIGKPEKAKKVADIIANRVDKELDYFIEKSRGKTTQWGIALDQIIGQDLRLLQLLANTTEQFDKPYSAKIKAMFDKQNAKLN
jgi:tetratricopeptide (TPR) repeat protein